MSEFERFRLTIESLVFDPAAPVVYEPWRGSLVWNDERSDAVELLGGEAWVMVSDLWAVRGCIHRGLPIEDLERYAGNECVDFWNECLFGGLQWIGFRRLVLTRNDRRILELGLNHPNPEDQF